MGDSEEGKIHIGLIGGIFASQPVGREILLRLARHILKGNKEGDHFISNLLDRVVLHFLPGVDPSFEHIKPYHCNPQVEDEVGKRLMQNKSEAIDPLRDALDQILVTEGFDAVVLFGGGNQIGSR